MSASNSSLTKRTLIGGHIARSVDTVGEEHDCFSTLDLVETLADYEIHCIIETCRLARVRIHLDDCADTVLIACRFGQQKHFITEGHNQNTILRAQLLCKCNGSF